MVRIKTNVYSHKRKKRVLKEARGQFGNRSKRYKEAIKSLTASRQYAFYDRRKKKGEFRALWIVRLNAACREAGMSYSRFIDGLNKANVGLDRKVLSELAISAPEAFQQIVDIAKNALATAPKNEKKEPRVKGKLATRQAAVHNAAALAGQKPAKKAAKA
jgi:large subunit ribosomal protein L20